MRTTDDQRVCPYTGLRSFTEDESLYFKGRDLQVDQITALLEQNKFLMVTGASGEGKSSLIYAGLIPNARAGFFRAKYSNWVVADFRPERDPVKNMAAAIAGKLDSHPASVETELRRGYSSLIDLYTNSSYFIDEENNSPDIPETEIRDKKRKAANLLIIVDQFEEFFTNPENFHNETLSKDSQIVVNLILETARIAIKKNLPVYVVCTMRSDYIGQCSAFRGLPEYIGFSQFFVPRLKRKDLKQVIEEPALLSGIKISQRLIERLVFDIAEGVDQLPILQHALSRIWMAADQGRNELDLIHYAMVGGMPAEDLPDEDMSAFKEWFRTIPETQQLYYKETGLSKIIEIHANLLYENAWEYYNKQNPGEPVTQREAKRIVAISFSCLTKIDNSRAVRNRMSLAEITSIINQPNLTEDVVGGVLNIFRAEGNSFIRPFITDDPATEKLSPDTVLDITHESLIRNWNKLNQWANKEFEFYSTYLDLQKQLGRWKSSGKSRGYLLPYGPLSYFEDWYRKAQPNAAWINRYTETSDDSPPGLQRATATLSDIKEFLKRSARNEFVTRSFMKYGPQRIAAVTAIGLMLVLSGFYWYNADQKKNSNVVQRVMSESRPLMKSQEVQPEIKAVYLLIEERQDSGSLMKYLMAEDVTSRVSLANEIYSRLMSVDKTEESPLKEPLTNLLVANLSDSDNALKADFRLAETTKLLIQLSMDQYYLPSPAKAAKLSAIGENTYGQVTNFFKNKNLFRATVPFDLNMAIQLWLTVCKPDSSKIQRIIRLVSPAAGTEPDSVFNLYYRKGSFEQDGRLQVDFNGGYHTLASLYAAAGDLPHVLWSFQKILDNNEHDYFELPRILNNHLNVLGYLYQYGHRNEVPGFLQWLQTHTVDNPPSTILRNAILRSGYISHMYAINIFRNYYRSTKGFLYPNLCLSDRTVFDAMQEDYEKEVLVMKDANARDFTMALNIKRKAMFYSKYWYDRKMPADENRLNQWLDEFVQRYQKLDKTYLEGTESSTLIYNSDGVRTANVKRKNLLIYPDHRDGWFSWAYHTDYYFNYLRKRNLLKTMFVTGEDLQMLHFWVAKAFEWKTDFPPISYSNTYPMSDETLSSILDFVNHHPEGASFDRNLIYLVLANHAYEKGDKVKGYAYYQQISLPGIQSSADRYEYLEKSFLLNQVKSLCVFLATEGKSKEANILASRISADDARSLVYVLMAEQTYRENGNPSAFEYLDSVYAISKRIDFSLTYQNLDCRGGQIRVLSQIGSGKLNQNANEILRDMPQQYKFDGIQERVIGIAAEGNYYRALTAIPKNLSETEDLICRADILLEDSRTKERISGEKRWLRFQTFVDWSSNYINFTPN